jgi:hypothetical protein
MLLTLFLDAHYGEGALVDFFGLLAIVVVLLVLLLVLWSRRIEKRFDREAQVSPSNGSGRGVLLIVLFLLLLAGAKLVSLFHS